MIMKRLIVLIPLLLACAAAFEAGAQSPPWKGAEVLDDPESFKSTVASVCP